SRSAQMWVHNFGEIQQVVEILPNDCFDNIQV
ncbi:MAG: hypothetical protein QOI59_5600, partial [Gammaproteobacteria bacterium]|nr:hypothetical protein [Gammaproteobacteria bacterium]